MQKNAKRSFDKEHVKRICITAMCIGLGALCKLFSLNVSLFGGSGMKIGLAGIFTSLPAIFYGPVYGGAASAASDILGCIIAPSGAYNPLYTLTAFAGGFVKGLVWRLLRNFGKKNMRITATACFAVFLALGIIFYAFLAADGINGGLFATAGEMPEKGEVASTDLSFVSRLITDRVRTTDTFTLKSVSDEETVVLPSVTYMGAKVTVDVGKGAFADCTALKSVYVPDAVKSVPYDETLAGVTFYVSEKAKSYDSLKKAGANIITEFELAPVSVTLNGKGVFAADGYTFSTNDSYRTNLAMYVNFATFALTLAGLTGLLLVLGEYLYSILRKGRTTYALRVFAAIFTCEMLVTTLNTVILKEITFSSTWANYPFIVVWIPRAIEGVFICVVQAYAITALLKAAERAPGLALEIKDEQKNGNA
ncbi:MAG: folate family ECF transporter S component [Clostridia bacterium]|nr:folate family ECF transporter S component [Clostridia bacterium]